MILILFFVVDIKPINVAVYSVKHHTMKDLLELDSKWFDYKHYLGPANDMTLRLDFSPKNQKKGGFKLASFGTASQPLFGIISVQNKPFIKKQERLNRLVNRSKFCRTFHMIVSYKSAIS